MKQRTQENTPLKTQRITDRATVQRLCFEILCDIDDFCRENNITYFLSGGSCLGAVRHQGFIPWDDDIDLMLPRADYERFAREFQAQHGDRYTVGTLRTNAQWARPYGKVWRNDTRLVRVGFDEMPMGVFVDIFPIDGLPQNPLVRWLHYRKTMVLHLCRNSAFHITFGKHERARLLKSLLSPLCKKIGARRIVSAFDRMIRRYDFACTPLVGVISAAHYWDKETMPRSVMSGAVQLPFCGRDFPVPIGYDTYLSRLYGDYMTPPSPEKIAAANHLENWEIELYTHDNEVTPWQTSP